MSDKIFDVWADYYNRVVAFDATKDTHESISKYEAMKIAAHLARVEIIADNGLSLKYSVDDVRDILDTRLYEISKK